LAFIFAFNLFIRIHIHNRIHICIHAFIYLFTYLLADLFVFSLAPHFPAKQWRKIRDSARLNYRQDLPGREIKLSARLN